MRGRKPTPTRLKDLLGSKRPRNPTEPHPQPATPPLPRHLDAEAAREWRRMVKELRALGLLTRIDRAALAAYCVNWSRWVSAENVLRQSGLVVKSADGGLYQNPYLAVANRALREMHRFLVEFGMTPSSRSRLHVSPAPSTADPFEVFLSGSSSAN